MHFARWLSLVVFAGILAGVLANDACLAKAAPAQKSPSLTFTYARPSGKDALRVLARTCSAKSWATVHDWAKQSGFISWADQDPIRVEVGSENVVFTLPSGEKGEFRRLDAQKIGISLAGKAIHGADACEMINNFLSDHNNKTALFSLLLPEAHGERVKQGLGRNIFYMAFGIMTGAVLLIGGVAMSGPASIGLMAVGVMGLEMGAKHGDRIAEIKDFEKVLNDDFELVCNKSFTSIKSGADEIIVRKIPSFTVEFATNHQTWRSNRESFYAIEARRLALKIANSCQTKADADKILSEYGIQKKEVTTRIATLEQDAKSPAQETAPH